MRKFYYCNVFFPRLMRIPEKTKMKQMILMEKYSLQEKFNPQRLKSRCV